MKRVVIVTGAHLVRNPRVVKEANALSEAGFDVTVLRPVLQDTLEEEDRALQAGRSWRVEPTADLRQSVQGLQARLIRRLGGVATKQGWQRPEALGYGMRTTLRRARQLQADLYIGHQEVGAWVVWRLMQEGYRVGADIEDWYSRDLLPEARAGRPLRLLKRIEGALLRHAPHVTTTSHAMAEAMATVYGAPKVKVIYNAFPWKDREAIDGGYIDRDPADKRPSLHWVSQTIGPGRGLEALCEALGQVKTPVQLHLRGQCRPVYRTQLTQAFPEHKGHSLFLHALVSPDELLSRIAEHDVGLALEDYTPPSRNLTVTNKILHYLLGGLAVLATDTDGQQEVARAVPAAVVTFPAEDPTALADALNRLLERPDAVPQARRAASVAARDTFSWEQQAPTLVRSVDRALTTPCLFTSGT